MIGSKRRRDNFKRLAIGSSIAAAAGYLAGILTAPKSGKETRKDIKQTADNGLFEAEKDLKRVHTELGRVMTDARQNGTKLTGRAQIELSEVLDKAKDTKEKAREVLSAIHEGDAEDKDLSRAIKDANAAIARLKKYLKK